VKHRRDERQSGRRREPGPDLGRRDEEANRVKWVAIGLAAAALVVAGAAFAQTTRGDGQGTGGVVTTTGSSPAGAVIPAVTAKEARPRHGDSDNQAGDSSGDNSGDNNAGDESGDNSGDNQAGDRQSGEP
jgi:hypothetical protein